MDRSKGWRWHKNRVKRYKDQVRHGQCYCCSNPRRHAYGIERLTRQEVMALKDQRDQEDITPDFEVYSWIV